MNADTIAAIATPPGRGGIGIIRISGPAAPSIAREITSSLPPPRQAELRLFNGRDCDGKTYIIDQGIVLYFPQPGSFTGEEVVELHGHGGPVILDVLLREILRLGARVARPGEFSERAFLNGKLDLTQAEAIADLIESSTAQAARNAARSLQGDFSNKIKSLLEELIELRMYVEASIDFPEEEVDFLSDSVVGQRLHLLLDHLNDIQSAAHQGQLTRDGLSLVIAGKPNAGKSSLMNQLAGRPTAIVTPVPGTTRDVLREQIQIDGLPIHIIDTAGLRDSHDVIEREGIRRALEEIEKADHLLLILDSNANELADDILDVELAGIANRLPKVTIVLNKCDLSGLPFGIHRHLGREMVNVSALTGEGIPSLREHLKRCVGYQSTIENGYSARRRHLDALERCRTAVGAGYSNLTDHHAGELLAEDLRLAQTFLGEITGEVTSGELLGRIFSSFCIGK